MGKAPAFPLYASDFYMDTSAWTVSEIGAYTRLLVVEEIHGNLPSEMSRLARIAGCTPDEFTPIWKTIKTKFDIDNSVLHSNVVYYQSRFIPKHIRDKVLSVGKCKLCGSDQNLEVDHIIPFSLGGSNDLNNLQCLCKSCNLSKGNKILSNHRKEIQKSGHTNA